MRILIWLLALAALAAGLAVAALHNDGYVLVALPPWRVELSLNLLLVLAMVGFFALYFVVRAITALIALPVSVREFRARHAHEKADAALRDGVDLFMEGRYSHALRRAEASYNADHAPLLASLLAQSAAHRMRDEARELLWRDRARQSDKGLSGARLMVEAGIATDKRDFASARELLDQFTRKGGLHVAAQRLALRVHQGMGQWQDVERVLRQLEKHHAMTPAQAAPLRQRAQREIISQLQTLGDGGAALLRFVNKLPEVDRLEPRLVLRVVPMLSSAGKHEEAVRLIEDALDIQWDSYLAAAYGDCTHDTLGRIAHAERWLPAHPRDHKLLLTLGRLCRRQQLWGKAQSYLEASLSVLPSRWVHLELAALQDSLGHVDRANIHYRAAAGEFPQG